MSENIKSVVTCDLDGKIETFNDGAEALFGYSPDEVIGKQRVSLFSPGLIVLGNVGQWLKEASEKGEWEGDTVFLNKNKEKIAAHIKITPTLKDGEQIGYCGVTTPLEGVDPASVEPKIKWTTKLFKWMVITRAPFLRATIVPVLLGGAVTSLLGFPVDLGVLGMTLLAACLVQIGANTANDYFDHTSGTDEATYDYIVPFSGGSRSIQMGLISPKGMLITSLVTLALGGIIAIPLIIRAGMPVFYLGLIGVLSSFFYTAPPLRLAARKGLGELLVGLNFGPLVVAGSTLVQTGTIESMALLVGVPAGLLTAAILWINQLPDYSGDKATGKDNLVVILGKARARYGYVALVVGAFSMIVAMVVKGMIPMLSLITLLAVYLGVKAISTLFKHYDDRLLVSANSGTINLHLITGILLTIGIWAG
ncbi:MAG: 1,4-dihydroxy-2-naphthoate octaprenyltransferase [Candidatus Marinimicrobia bacterium]|nr:1,4-dihydroxy-2-naphthoate octaprenyltransferase [Candidatus Neomarinimicrobiota bacterium]